MGTTLLWTGATFILALPHLGVNGIAGLIGALLMVIGCVMIWLGK